MVRLSDEQLAEMVRRLPNGCALSHFSNGPEMDDAAWSVLDAQGNVLSEGASPEEALHRLGAQMSLPDAEPSEVAQEREYRRGYCDGWLGCMSAALDLGLAEQASDKLASHWDGPLVQWQQGDCSREVPPPEMWRRGSGRLWRGE